MNRFFKVLLNILKFALAAFMVFSGVQHFVNPTPYINMIPDFLPWPDAIVFLSGVAEALFGILLVARGRTSTFAALMIFLMMLVFLPLHVADIFREVPTIAGFAKPGVDLHQMAVIRVVMQFVFIIWTFAVFRFTKKTNGCFMKCCSN